MLTGLCIGLRKYRNFQSEARFEQIIAIVTTHSVFLFELIEIKFLIFQIDA